MSDQPRSDEYYLAMAALDMYLKDDGPLKSTSVVFRIHELGHRLEAAVAQPVKTLTHRCSGCDLRWVGDSVGAELCGDCWRKAQSVVHHET